MDEIFLQDYANNVAQAQDPYGIAAVQAQPGFENYTPSFVNQSLTPMGLTEPQGTQLPDFKEMAKNVAIDQAKKFAIKKAGLEGIKGNVFSSILGVNPYMQGIATLGTALTGNSLNISNILAQKRAEKAYGINQKRMQNELNKQQTQAIQQRLDSQPVSNQDSRRGDTTSTTSSAPAARQSRQTSGSGGLHSGY